MGEPVVSESFSSLIRIQYIAYMVCDVRDQDGI